MLSLSFFIYNYALDQGLHYRRLIKTELCMQFHDSELLLSTNSENVVHFFGLMELTLCMCQYDLSLIYFLEIHL